MKIKQLTLSIFFIFLLLPLTAQIKLPPMFSTNMVIQQATPVPIWGKAAPNVSIKVNTSWDQANYDATSDSNGDWRVTVKTPSAGGPYKITITQDVHNRIVLSNVMAGDVWICSGQSNMEFPMKGWDTGAVKNYQSEVNRARYPLLRFLQVKKNISYIPVDTIAVTDDGWKVCTPSTVKDFSAVAYFFGKNIVEDRNIPIGLISTNWGGTVAEAWTSEAALQSMSDFKKSLKQVNKRGNSHTDYQAIFDHQYAAWEKKTMAKDPGFKSNVPLWAQLRIDTTGWNSFVVPGSIDDQGLATYDGTIWYRKEITIPQGWSGQSLDLSLGAIDDNDITYFNGVKIGSTDGCAIKRHYTIPASLVKEGKAIIAIRIMDTGGSCGIAGGYNDIYVESPENRISLAGNWNTHVGVSLDKLPSMPINLVNNPNVPTVLYNGMIHPLLSTPIKGAIWYQGEANVDRAYQYSTLFPVMIQDWRKQWKSDFPFYFVQLANFTALQTEPVESNWAELREAQTQTLKLSNTGMAVTIDLGEAGDIHPKNKQDVGFRLALLARAKTYHETGFEYYGPMYDSAQVVGNSIKISFTHADGLKTKNNEAIKGFSIAGEDHHFYWATAKIEGNNVIVSCPQVPAPVAVRYGWANNPITSLYNTAELPMAPFRTDTWKGITYNKK